jgi:hypothetical protein
MRKIRFIITIILGLFASQAWADGVVDSINHIKRDTTYLYGEATMPTLKSADSLARKELALKVREWMYQQTDQIDSTEIDDSRLSPYISVLTNRRADMIRGFAYVRKADLRQLLNTKDTVQGTITAKPIEDTDSIMVTDSIVKVVNISKFRKPLKRDDVLKQILKAKNFFELRDTMKTLIRQGAVSNYGKRETCKQPEACYWIVYDRTGNIKAILGKGQTIRKNFKTGRVDSLANYQGKGYAGIWFQIKEQ